MRRLVYSPKVQAWINGTEGVVDVSPYIVSGSIDRKVNAVSTASLVLRNPVSQGTEDYTGTLFTEFKRSDGTIGPLFHPMDPIIITMQRLEGHNIQVFTGYLDKSPYLQFYPGLCQIDASCTLKRLQYTQWDAALPFVTYFLSLFGWTSNGQDGIMNPSTEAEQLKVFAGEIQSKFTDGSIGNLIYAILVYVAQWDDSNVFIEKLPPNLADYIVKLYTELEKDVNQSQNIFQSLLTQILGTSSLGNGSTDASGTASSPVLNAQDIVSTVAPIAAQYSIPLELVLAVMYIETSFTGKDSSGSKYHGWFQTQLNGAYAYGPWKYGSGLPSSIAQAHSLPDSATAFCAAAQGWVAAMPTLKNNLQEWAMKVQGVNVRNNPRYASSWADAIATAKSYIKKFGGGTLTTSTLGASPFSSFGLGGTNAGTSPTATTDSPSTGVTTTTSGKSPGGKTGKTSSGNSGGTNYLANIFPTGTQLTLQRTDSGVDFDAPEKTPIGAIADGVVSLTTSDGFDGQPLLMVTLDKAINGYKAWYIAEGIHPTKTSGRVVAGEQIAFAESHQTGIETGWADPHTGYPHANASIVGTYTGYATLDGIAFANTLGVPILHTNQPSQPYTVTGTGAAGTAGVTGSGVTATSGGNSSANATATASAFSTMINLPSTFQTAEAVAFTGKRAFIADSPLFPFIEQLCQASLRNFMSMPNGNFFAFFPDYFGLFGRDYYWEIKDIEIMDGRIDLSDDPLTTHLAIAGDVTQYSGTVNVFDLLLTAGIFDIFDAFALGYVSGPDSLVQSTLSEGRFTTTKKARTQTKQEAVQFLQKYGARPYIEEIPAIRSPFFELFYAFMKFMLLWSKQFQTSFELTFMPELFPGGLVAFPDHDLQLYVEEVSHNFDYTSGFSTTASFSSPASLSGQRPNMREGLTRLSPNQLSTPVDALTSSSGKKSTSIPQS